MFLKIRTINRELSKISSFLVFVLFLKMLQYIADNRQCSHCWTNYFSFYFIPFILPLIFEKYFWFCIIRMQNSLVKLIRHFYYNSNIAKEEQTCTMHHRTSLLKIYYNFHKFPCIHIMYIFYDLFVDKGVRNTA